MHRRLEWLPDDSDSPAPLSPSRSPASLSSSYSWQSWLLDRVHSICLCRGKLYRSCLVPAQAEFERNRRDSRLSWFSLHAMGRARICLLREEKREWKCIIKKKNCRRRLLGRQVRLKSFGLTVIVKMISHISTTKNLRRIHKWTH